MNSISNINIIDMTNKKPASLFYAQHPFVLKNVRIKNLDDLLTYVKVYDKFMEDKYVEAYEYLHKMAVENITPVIGEDKITFINRINYIGDIDEYDNARINSGVLPIESDMFFIGNDKTIKPFNYKLFREVFAKLHESNTCYLQKSLILGEAPNLKYCQLIGDIANLKIVFDLSGCKEKSYKVCDNYRYKKYDEHSTAKITSKIIGKVDTSPVWENSMSLNQMLLYLSRLYLPESETREIDRNWKDVYGLSITTVSSDKPKLNVLLPALKYDKSLIMANKYKNLNIFIPTEQHGIVPLRKVFSMYREYIAEENLNGTTKDLREYVFNIHHGVLPKGTYLNLNTLSVYDNLIPTLARLFNVCTEYEGVSMNEYTFLTGSTSRKVDNREVAEIINSFLSIFYSGDMSYVSDEVSFMFLIECADLLKSEELVKHAIRKLWQGKLSLPENLTLEDIYKFDIVNFVIKDKFEEVFNSLTRMSSYGDLEYFEDEAFDSSIQEEEEEMYSEE